MAVFFITCSSHMFYFTFYHLFWCRHVLTQRCTECLEFLIYSLLYFIFKASGLLSRIFIGIVIGIPSEFRQKCWHTAQGTWQIKDHFKEELGPDQKIDLTGWVVWRTVRCRHGAASLWPPFNCLTLTGETSTAKIQERRPRIRGNKKCFGSLVPTAIVQ